MIEAVVQVGALETRYLRCGRGPSVVLLLADAPDPGAVARLAADHRVIIPTPPVPPLAPGDLERWLRGLIEGLGLEQPVLALAPGLARLAPRLLDGCGDLVACIRTA